MLVEDMAYFGCTIQEIASMLNTTQPTISNNYRQVLNRAQTRWCYDLRKAQTFNGLYNRGNCTMLVWLGKQYLAQKDDPHNEMHQNTFDEFVQWMKTQVSSDSPPSS